MADKNLACRQVCDVDIRVLKDKSPFLFVDTCNATTIGLSGDSVYAMAKGERRIAFQNPLEASLTLELQVVPFKFYAMISDGTIKTDALVAVKKTIKAAEAGKIALTATNGTIQPGSVFVYKAGEFGNDAIEGTFAEGNFTATQSTDIAVDTEYEVGYLINRNNGVKRVSFNSATVPQDYFITMSTLEKAEDGTMIPYIFTCYKASINRNFEMAFSSEGDPMSISLQFDLMHDSEGNLVDMVEDFGE